jgi:hypothetical protein
MVNKKKVSGVCVQVSLLRLSGYAGQAGLEQPALTRKAASLIANETLKKRISNVEVRYSFDLY